MFCPTCNCEFTGWTGKCPNCGTLLVLVPEEQTIYSISTQGTALSYNALIDLERGNDGKLIIEVSTTEVDRKKRVGIPLSGIWFHMGQKGEVYNYTDLI